VLSVYDRVTVGVMMFKMKLYILKLIIVKKDYSFLDMLNTEVYSLVMMLYTGDGSLFMMLYIIEHVFVLT